MSYEVWGEPDDGPELPDGWLDKDAAQELRDRITELEAVLCGGHVAWMRYVEAPNGSTVIRLCDSDTEGAFKVYREAAPTQGADARPVAITVPVPTERGIYAWIAEGSASLVLVHTRPSDHSPGGVMKATNIRNCTFYEGCPVEQWHGGTWYGPLTKDATRDAAPSDEHAKLLQFYAVDTPDALIVAMERHIEKLQSKLPKDNQPAFSRHREG